MFQIALNVDDRSLLERLPEGVYGLVNSALLNVALKKWTKLEKKTMIFNFYGQ
jgi:hypothetical protein